MYVAVKAEQADGVKSYFLTVATLLHGPSNRKSDKEKKYVRVVCKKKKQKKKKQMQGFSSIRFTTRQLDARARGWDGMGALR